MNILFVGSSSFIANLLKKKIKHKICGITSSKKKSKNTYNIDSYSEKSISKAINFFKKKNISFDCIIFFNGYHKMSLLSFFNENLFNEIFQKNLILPIKINSLIMNKHILNHNCSIIFVGSIAAELNEIGNAYYSLSKLMLEKCVKILSFEQKKKLRFNLVSLGLVKNKVSKDLIKNLPSNYKNKHNFIKNELIINKFKNLIEDKKVKNRIIKIHGNYKKN